MAHPVSVTGTVTLSNGQTVDFEIDSDGSVSRWGNYIEHLYDAVTITEDMAAAAVPYFTGPSDED